MVGFGVDKLSSSFCIGFTGTISFEWYSSRSGTASIFARASSFTGSFTGLTELLKSGFFRLTFYLTVGVRSSDLLCSRRREALLLFRTDDELLTVDTAAACYMDLLIISFWPYPLLAT